MNRDILRLLDANLNRAVEGIRVLEEAARMLRNDGKLTRELKDLRHALVGVVRGVEGLDSRMLLARDSEGDVLREGDTPSERTRADLGAVIRANAGRAQEAVRSLEEYVKLVHPELSVRFKSVRFGLYDGEKKLAALLKLRETVDAYRLGVIVMLDRVETGEADIADLIRTVTEAGAGIVVYRDLRSPGADLLRNAEHAVAACREGNTSFFIGGRPDVALLTGADGLQMETGDLPAERCRTLIGRETALCLSFDSCAVREDCPVEDADFLMIDIRDGEDFRAPVLRPELPFVALGRFDRACVDAMLDRGAAGVGIRPRRDELPGLVASVAEMRRKVDRHAGAESA